LLEPLIGTDALSRLASQKTPDECKNGFRLDAIKVSACRRPLKYEKSLLGIVLSLGVLGLFCSLRLFKREGDVADIAPNGVLSCLPQRARLDRLVKRVFHLEDDVIAKEVRCVRELQLPSKQSDDNRGDAQSLLGCSSNILCSDSNGVLTVGVSPILHRTGKA
jgi:hypothetical protein